MAAGEVGIVAEKYAFFDLTLLLELYKYLSMMKLVCSLTQEAKLLKKGGRLKNGREQTNAFVLSS